MHKRLTLRNAKIAWVTPSLGTAGSLLYMQPLLESLALSCATFRVFMPEVKGKPDLGFEVECCGHVKIIKPQFMQSNLTMEGYQSEFRFISPKIISSLLRYQPDLIILNDFSIWAFFAVMARPLLPKIKVLLVVETKPRVSSQNNWILLVRRIIRSFVVRGADFILTNNIDGSKYLTFELSASKDRVITRPYLTSDMASLSGMSKEEIWRLRSSRQPRMPVRFLYVGSLIPRKGLHYAFTALAKLLPEYANQFCFDVIGEGPVLDHLQQQVFKLGLSKYVNFHGKQPYSSLWQWYLRADVFLFPTLADYRALVPFEALSMGLPLISSVHDGGVMENVDEGRNGFSCDPRDTAALAKILAHFLKAPEIFAIFGQRSLEIASAYTLERTTESLIYACQRTLDSKSI